MKFRKILLVILFILIIIGVVILLYTIFFKTPIPEELTPGDQPAVSTSTRPIGSLPPISGTSGPTVVEPAQPETSIPDAEDQRISIIDETIKTPTAVSDYPLESLTIDPKNNSFLYYNPTDSKFYRLDSNGASTLLLNQEFPGVQNVTWSPDKDKMLLELKDESQIIYSLKTQKQLTTIPKHWSEIRFSPDSSQIAFKRTGIDPDNNWLSVSGIDGNNIEHIQNMGTNADIVTVNWSPTKQIVGMYRKGIDFDRQELFFIGLNDENFKSTILPGRNFSGMWTPKGDKLLYSIHRTQTENKPELWIVDAQGESIGSNRRMLNVNTWVDKCIFKDQDNIICAVPQKLVEGSGYVPAIANTVPDDIYTINLKLGSKTRLATFDSDHTVNNLFLSENSKLLYFTDKNTGKLYKIEL